MEYVIFMYNDCTASPSNCIYIYIYIYIYVIKKKEKKKTLEKAFDQFFTWNRPLRGSYRDREPV